MLVEPALHETDAAPLMVNAGIEVTDGFEEMTVLSHDARLVAVGGRSNFWHRSSLPLCNSS